MKEKIPEFVLIIVGFIGLYIQNYLSQKGKNLATKEDIEEITSKIENIKNEVSLKSQIKLEYIVAKKKSLLDFLDLSNNWLDFTLNPFDRLHNNLEDPNLIKKLIISLKETGSKASNLFWRIGIYHNTNVVNEVSSDYYYSLIDLHNKTLQYLIKLERKAVRCRETRVWLEDCTSFDKASSYSEDLKKEQKEAVELYDKFLLESKELTELARKNRHQYIALMNIMTSRKKNASSNK